MLSIDCEACCVVTGGGGAACRCPWGQLVNGAALRARRGEETLLKRLAHTALSAYFALLVAPPSHHVIRNLCLATQVSQLHGNPLTGKLPEGGIAGSQLLAWTSPETLLADAFDAAR